MKKNTIAKKRTCEVKGCSRPHYAFGCCYMHYRRIIRGNFSDLPAGFVGLPNETPLFHLEGAEFKFALMQKLGFKSFDEVDEWASRVKNYLRHLKRRKKE